MKIPPKGACFKKQTLTKTEYLESVLRRLRDDVGNYLEFLQAHNQESTQKIGYWASLRLLLPIVEAVAHVAGEKPQEFLGKHLGIEVPYLVWDLFRHSLIHGDILQHAEYDNIKVDWGVDLAGANHIVETGFICIDSFCLYERPSPVPGKRSVYERPNAC